MTNEQMLSSILKDLILETLLPPNQEYVEEVYYDLYWIAKIGGKQYYLGDTFKSAELTASLGDWVDLTKEGFLPTIRSWFEIRAVNSNWESLETDALREFRLSCIEQNLMIKFSVPPVMDFVPLHPECDGGSLLDWQEESLYHNEYSTADLSLREVELISVSGLEPTLFTLSGDNEYLTPTRIMISQDGFSIHQSLNIVEAPINAKFRTVGVLLMDEEGEFISFEHYYPNSETPMAIYRKEGETIVLNSLRLG